MEPEDSLQMPLIGCCGWAGAQKIYFSEFQTIEIQSTFYDPPAVKVAERWKLSAPKNFVFCIKAWQLITHAASSPTYRRLRSPVAEDKCHAFGFFQDTDEVWAAWQKTVEIANAVGAAIVLLQCPASFKPIREYVANLRHFLERIGQQPFQIAWEPRGAWPTMLLKELCDEYNLIHCVDPLVAVSVHNRVYWRLHGGKNYTYRYTDEDLISLKNLYFGAERQAPAYVMFNNISMKEDALRFIKLFQEDSTSDYLLPEYLHARR